MTDATSTGLVVAGAGARGAYEAGALSVLVPRMAASGHAPDVLVGTSAGALNVAALAGTAEQGWAEAAENLPTVWGSVSFDQVADLTASLFGDAVSYSAMVAGLGGELTSLLDTTPLRSTVEQLMPLTQLHENISSGLVRAVAVATTSTTTGATVVFLEAHDSVPTPPFDARRNIVYVRTRLTVDHLLASAAVPVAFRPVLIDGEGWYVDGGVRLNTPLKPALTLGCDRLGVVATHPPVWPVPEERPSSRPDVFRAASLALQSLLADTMVRDLHTLATVNTLLGDTASRTRRLVPFLFAGPSLDNAHEISALANRVVADHTEAWSHRDSWLLNRLIGGKEQDHGDLLSFLLFDSRFTTEAALLGALHARHSLPAGAYRTTAEWPTTLDESAT